MSASERRTLGAYDALLLVYSHHHQLLQPAKIAFLRIHVTLRLYCSLRYYTDLGRSLAIQLQ